ncbi:hypothetical protein Tco_0471179 [Tanacetum coccineum]
MMLHATFHSLKLTHGTNPSVLIDKTKSAGDELETAYAHTRFIKVLADLKGILDKLDEFQTSISVLTTKVASLEGFKLEIPTDYHHANNNNTIPITIHNKSYKDHPSIRGGSKSERKGRKLRLMMRRVQGKITNCNVLTRGKGPINLKVYRDDGSNEINYNFKISDLHVVEWKIVLDACPKRTGAGWNIIYTQIRKKLDDIHKT